MTTKKKTIKVEPVIIDKKEYKIYDIDYNKKKEIGNLIFNQYKLGEPDYNFMCNILIANGYSEDEILYLDFDVVGILGNAIVEACNLKKKKKK